MVKDPIIRYIVSIGRASVQQADGDTCPIRGETLRSLFVDPDSLSTAVDFEFTQHKRVYANWPTLLAQAVPKMTTVSELVTGDAMHSASIWRLSVAA